jgi:hypothetical protein
MFVTLYEISWQVSIVSLFPSSIIMVVSDETIKISVESFEFWLNFFNSMNLSHMLSIFLRDRETLLKSLILSLMESLVVSMLLHKFLLLLFITIARVRIRS